MPVYGLVFGGIVLIEPLEQQGIEVLPAGDAAAQYLHVVAIAAEELGRRRGVGGGVASGLALVDTASILPALEGALGGAGNGFVDGDVDELPLACEGALQEGGDDGGDGVFAGHPEGVLAIGTDGGQVVVVVAGAHGRSAEGHADEVGGIPVAAGAGEAEGGDRAPEEAGRVGGEGLVTKTEGIESARLGAVDDDVGASDEAAPAPGIAGVGQGEGNAALVRVEVGKAEAGVGVGAVVDEGAGVAGAGALGGFDADDLNTGIGEELAGDLAAVADLQGGEAGEGSGHQTAPPATSASYPAWL